jgi:hypothetical protein
MKKLIIISLLLSATVCGSNDLRNQYKAPYEGNMLNDAFNEEIYFICMSDHAGSTGFYPNPKSRNTELISEFKKQTPQFWHFFIGSDAAFAKDSQGNEQKMLTMKYNSEGITLVGLGRNESTQVVTIYPSNSSFVYTTQNSSMLWNRASTFVGKCITRSLNE